MEDPDNLPEEASPVQPATETVKQADYFGFEKTDKYMFPDGISYLEFKAMNEGQKAQYQRDTRQDMVLERQSGNARIKVDQAQERHALIKNSVVGWNLVKGGRPLPFNTREFNAWLDGANPDLVQEIEKFVRKLNPWMFADLTAKDIQEQIDELQEQLEAAKEREAEKGL